MNHNYYLFYFKLVYTLFLLESSLINSRKIKYIRNFQNKNSEIHMVIQGSGLQRIISGDYEGIIPEVLVEGIKKNSCGDECFFENEKNNVILRFGTQLRKLEKMFYYLDNLIEIDFSNFDASAVTTMEGMLNSCSNLEKVTFGNIDTSSLQSIRTLFLGCYKLTTIDLSNF